MEQRASRKVRGTGREQGFTLIELMIVVVIISLISAIAIPMYSDAMRKARTAALTVELEKLYNALMSYHADNNSFPSEGLMNNSTLSPLSTNGYFPIPESLTNKLIRNQLLFYFAPDVGGTDSQFIIVVRHIDDADLIGVVVYTDIIEGDGDWLDGVFFITENELADADDVL